MPARLAERPDEKGRRYQCANCRMYWFNRDNAARCCPDLEPEQEVIDVDFEE